MSLFGIDHHAAISAISERVAGLSKGQVRMRSVSVAIGLLGLSLCGPARALETVKVTDGIYAFVGEKTQRSPLNLGNNATFGLVVTTGGALLIDPGGSWKGAAALHAAIRKVTDQPVRYVVNTGGQDHRWLGNGYWHNQGAVIIAATTAIADQKARGSLQLINAAPVVRRRVGRDGASLCGSRLRAITHIPTRLGSGRQIRRWKSAGRHQLD